MSGIIVYLGAAPLLEIEKNLLILDQTCRRLRRQAGLAKIEREMVPEDIDLSENLEICVISQMDMDALRCRILGGNLVVNLRTERQDIVPGEIILVKPSGLAPVGEDLYLSGEIISTRIDAPALGLRQLLLSNNNEMWNPEGEDWLKGNTEACYQSIMAYGPRLIFQMEQVIPMADVRGRHDDVLDQAITKMKAGDQRSYPDIRMLIMETLDLDLRCLLGHSLLDYLAFKKTPEIAIKHYEIGVRIGEASLGKSFNGVLQWSAMGNRLFLLCLHGYGLCLWRLGFIEDAAKVFEQILWFSTSDKLGVRHSLKYVRNGEIWRPKDAPPL
ncbi:MAG: hypothetical protein ABSC17_06590 [Thermacetogeniaceae bacterium]